MPVDISKLTKVDVAKKLDYALLQPYWQDEHQLAGCEDVRKYKFAAFYVLANWTPLIIGELKDFAKENDVLLGTGIGFPYGSHTTKNKLAETEEQLEFGCTVLDMVANIALLKDKKYDLYQQECDAFTKMCHDAGAVAKIIIQVGYLTPEEIVAATKMVVASGAEHVKTATGTGPSGRPNFQDAKLILDTLAELNTTCKMKVSGVVEPRIINAYNFIRMGADLIGTRSAVEIIEALPDVQKTLFPS